MILVVPLSINKTEWACRVIIFLGILLNRQEFYLSIPEEKRLKAIQALHMMIDKRKATVKEIQSLAGLLNFLNRAIFAGRAFTRRMYAKYVGIVEKKAKLKPYHHVKVDSEFKADCQVWLSFLETNLITSVNRPFVDLVDEEQNQNVLRFYSDASLNPILGFRAWYGSQWTYAQWPENFISTCEPSIEYVELYTLVVAVEISGQSLKNHRVGIFCDNQSVVHMVNNSTSSCGRCMILIRILVLK